MLKTRVIPSLLLSSHGLVKGVSFNSWRRIGTLLPAIRVYRSRDVDELILLDTLATLEERGPDVELIEEIAPECSFPLTIGGGIYDTNIIRSLLLAGADKVALNTATYSNLKIIEAGAHKFGAQCIVASVDFRRLSSGSMECFSHAGKNPTGRGLIQWARQLESRGAGEILLTSIDRDGTMSGYDLEAIEQVSHSVKIPVIASGGAGKLEDFLSAIQSGASAVCAASLFHFTETTPNDVKRYLGENGVHVRKSVRKN